MFVNSSTVFLPRNKIKTIIKQPLMATQVTEVTQSKNPTNCFVSLSAPGLEPAASAS